MCLQVRTRALRLLLQLLTCCPAEQLRGALRSLPLASFLAGLLAGRDAATAAAALLCCEVLMAQLPDVFKHVFLREGVAHAVEQLAATAAATAAAAPAAVAPAPAGPPAVAAPAPAPAEEPRRCKWGVGNDTDVVCIGRWSVCDYALLLGDASRMALQGSDTCSFPPRSHALHLAAVITRR